MAAPTAPVAPGAQPFVPDGSEPTWFGHPKGLFTLFFAELWERFCYYGMRALLAVYVADQFFNGDKEAAGGMYGAFTALIYALGFFGGIVADRVLGYRRSIMVGGVFMAVGEFLLMIPSQDFFLLGLGGLVVGNGLFKPNISTLVGKLYKQGDPRRDGGFTIFYMGINLGAFLAPILCAEVARLAGGGGRPDYRWGFFTAGAGMLLGVVTFWKGFRHLGDKGLPPPGREKFSNVWAVVVGCIVAVPAVYFLLSQKKLAGVALGVSMIGIFVFLLWYGTKAGKVVFQRIVALIILLMGNIVFWASFEQAGNSLNFFAQNQVKWRGEERFPLGGTHGDVLAVGPDTITVSEGFSRAEETVVSVTYPQPQNPNYRDTATAKLPPGSYRSGEPIRAQFTVTKKGDGSKVTETGVANPMLGSIVGAAADARAKAEAAKVPETAPSEAKKAAEAAKAQADKLAVDFVAGPVRPFEWFQSVNAIFIVMLGPVFSFLWVWLDRKGRNPSIPVKFGLGLIQVGLGFLLLVASFKGADEAGLVPWYLLTAVYLIHTTGELCISPVGLSMITKLAPPTITGFVMGGWFLSIANANYVAGWFSQLAAKANVSSAGEAVGAAALSGYEAAFVPIIWMSVSVGVLLVLLGKPLSKLMHGVK
ncbi:MAG TPA: peptide MFS transporter [Planctomycetota bacterium]|nr:peptide MFS transporter [Planctomycetota bacterium]